MKHNQPPRATHVPPPDPHNEQGDQAQTNPPEVPPPHNEQGDLVADAAKAKVPPPGEPEKAHKPGCRYVAVGGQVVHECTCDSIPTDNA